MKTLYLRHIKYSNWVYNMENKYSNTWFTLFMDTIPTSKTHEEVEFIKSLIPAQSYPRLLDLCCGSGRHAELLSGDGYNILGLDSNNMALEKARSLKLQKATFLQTDIFNFSLEPNSLDAVICMWQSFGYGDESQNKKLVDTLWNALKKDGVFLLDIYNKDFFEKFLGERTFEVSGKRVTELKEIKSDRLIVTLTYENSEDRDVFNWQIFSPLEIEAYMNNLNFKLIGSYSSFSKDKSPESNNPRAQYLFKKMS